MKKIAIAIDGPAAAGKSTVAKIVAEKLQYVYIDTGAMYRAVTLYVLDHQIDVQNEERISKILPNITITFEQQTDGQHVYLNGVDITDEIRSTSVTNNVSLISSYSSVREEMVRRQQEFVADRAVVMDGRDIGTHVIPDAEIKFFLIASVDERAERRYHENKRRGFNSDIEQIKKEIRERDLQDMQRKVSPLVKAEDAIELDTTSYSIGEVADQMLQQIYNVIESA
ncbi:MAG TPA: (d)CMP kinase [Bacillota bacterium]|nr:(d)CMP kinase [Bacillota bacterium]